MILTYTKDFSWEKKNDPNSPDFKEKKFQNRRIFFYKIHQVGGQENTRILC